MLRLSNDLLEVVDNFRTRPSPVCGLASVPNIEHVKPQSSGECTGASLVEPESFMVPTVEDRGEAKACAPDASIPSFGKLNMQTSEACHKSYAIFDHCEGKNTVILHPSWLNSPPFESWLEPNFAREGKYFIGGLEAFNNNSIEAMYGFCSSAALSPAGLEFLGHRQAPEHTMQVQQISSKEKYSFIEFVNSRQAQNSKKNTGFPLDIEGDSQNEFHENTEEINALLSSDDEFSTGHSPSDASSTCSGAKNDNVNRILGKKRKLEECTLDEVDDADSGVGKPAPDHTFLNSKMFGSWVSLHFPIESDHKDIFSGLEVSNISCGVKDKSTIGVSEQVTAKKSRCESKQSSETFGEGEQVDSSTRIKIKNSVQQLKNVIPGGDGLDMAGVLGRTVQYMKCLQNRLRDLEAAREFQRLKK